MSDVLAQWTKQAEQMQGRKLSEGEAKALGDELLKGHIHPDTDVRKRKRAIRRAVASAAKPS